MWIAWDSFIQGEKTLPLSLSSMRTNVYSAWKSYFLKYISSTYKYLFIYTSKVCTALLSIVLPAAAASDKSALSVWFQIQEDDQQTGLNKHLRDAGMAFTKSVTISQAFHMPENLPIKVRQGFSGEELLPGDMATDFKLGFNVLKFRNRANLDLEAHAKNTSVFQ